MKLIQREWSTNKNPAGKIEKHKCDREYARQHQVNLGIHLGPSHWASIDCDSEVARLLAPHILIPTTVVGKDCHKYGSNYLYECKGATFLRHPALSTCDNYAELLGGNRVTSAPGSFCQKDHKPGYPDTFVKFWDMGPDEYPVLTSEFNIRKTYACLVTASYIYDTWTDQRHNDGAGPWAGFLLKTGMTAQGVKLILKTISDLHGKGRKWVDEYEPYVDRVIADFEKDPKTCMGHKKLVTLGYKAEDLDILHTLLDPDHVPEGMVVWSDIKLAECVDRVAETLRGENGLNRVMSRGGKLVMIEESVPCHVHQMDLAKYPPIPMPVPLNPASLRLRISRTQSFTTRIKGHLKPIGCPKDIPETILAAYRNYFPPLNGVCDTPFIDLDGNVVSGLGYHESTGLWLNCDWGTIDVSEAGAALDYIKDEVLAEFPFATPRDKTVAISLLLTAIQRKMLSYDVPAFHTNAPTRSSGKTALIRLIFMAASGRVPAATSFPTSEEEMQKMLLGIFMEAHPFVLFDDVEIVASREFAKVVTSPMYTTRLLGKNEMPAFSTSVTWAFTGNNTVFRDDMATRTLICELDADHDAPETRTFARPNLVEWAAKNRRKIVEAALTILLAHRKAGSPAKGVATRFSGWARMIRDPLTWLGEPDIAEVFQETREADPNAHASATIIKALHKSFGTDPFKAGEVAGKCMVDPGTGRAVHKDLADAMGLYHKMARSGVTAGSVGGMLRAYKNQRVGDLKLVHMGGDQGWKIRSQNTCHEEEVPF